ncbi:transketolase [Flagellimonas sp. CMM7]|uniref:transketolase n=1 Tax=Flagellimonas sp. CMM7 TaxID=2654676 RepID=UPI0013D7541E|nr:transketolase [Flagellimonas sp. CMM7]UII80302.1 transketolase [Flagellimonas sp. CMM7]
MKKDLEQLCINTIRTLSMDAVQAANSGHPGTPMALAPVAYTIYDRFMKFNPENPDWVNRDRFILSAGHASMLLYSTLHVTGYDVTLDDIKSFRQLHSKCAGHPEYGHTPGVETTTGPLGQGLATSVGFAIAQKWLADRFNKPDYNLLDYRIFSLAGDGCMMEGISGEAASLAGHLGLNNLIWLYDNNKITIEGNTDLAFTEDVATRFIAYGWNVQRIGDANDLEMLDRAISIAKKERGRPTLIIVDSHIAYGAPTKQDTHGAHGSPLGEEEIKATKAFYGWDPDKSFFVPDEVKKYAEEITARGKTQNKEWDDLFAKYKKDYPELGHELKLIQNKELPQGWDSDIPVFEAGTEVSGRVASSKVLNAIASKIPFMIGGSADLSPSTLTDLKKESSFQSDNHGGKNIHYGIREHAMGAIANGIALAGLKTFDSTFMVFSDYARSSIRLSALMNLPVTHIFTHDSIGVGEDGPTHQPIEHIASLRAIPNLEVIRPADANEVAVLWKHIMQSKNTPTALILSRQNLPVFDRTKYTSADGALKGGYVMADSKGTPDVILIATGSEVQIAIEAYEALKLEGINPRVVSLPSWNLYGQQSPEYWESVLPSKVKARVAIEAGSTFGWRRFVGLHGEGEVLGMRTFGASGKLNNLLQEFGLTVDAVVSTAKSVIKHD